MLSRTQIARFAALALVGMLTGCHKKVRVKLPPAAPISVPATSVPEHIPEAPSLPPPMSSGPGVSEPVPVPDKPTTTPPRRNPARPVVNPTANPSEQPEQPDLGDLTEGGATDANILRTQAQSLIADMDRRLRGVPSSTRQQSGRQVAQVELFLKQAKDALSAGDLGGANNLATKSKVLLDDLLK